MDTCLYIIILHFDICFLDHIAYLCITQAILHILACWTYDVLIHLIYMICLYRDLMSYIGCLDDLLFDDFLLQ